MRQCSVLIVTAVPFEAKGVAKALGMTKYGDGRWTAGGHPSVELRTIGIRATRLPNIEATTWDCAILAGLAGALDDSLKVGDVVLEQSCPAEWRAAFEGRIGLIATANMIVASPADKSALFRKTGALAVDMEFDVVRRWADAAGVPLIALRAISDAAGDTLDPAVLQLLDDSGNVRLFMLLRSVLCRPALLIRLIRLGLDSGKAGKALGQAVRHFVEKVQGSADLGQ